MGQISLTGETNQPFTPEMIRDIDQKMDLWNGLVTSQYRINPGLSRGRVLYRTGEKPSKAALKTLVQFFRCSGCMEWSSILNSVHMAKCCKSI